MPTHRAARERGRPHRAVASVGWVVVLLLSTIAGPIAIDVGGGLFTSGTTSQTISQLFNSGEGICAQVGVGGACFDSSGLAYDPSTHQVIMTETSALMFNDLGPSDFGHNFSLVFQPDSRVNFTRTNLSCTSASPYYPGSGGVYFVPCTPPSLASNNASLLTIDVGTNQVVGQIPFQGFWTDWYGTDALAWDPVNHLLYACDGGLVALNITSQTKVFSAPTPGGCAWVVYDSWSNALLVSGSTDTRAYGDRMIVVDPGTGQVERTVFGADVTAAVVDPDHDWLAAGIGDPGSSMLGSVEIANASTFVPVANVSVPELPPSGGSSIPNQILIDPTHGDLYALTWGGAYAINLTDDVLVATLGTATDLASFPAIYLASTDSIYISSEESVDIVALDHGTTTGTSTILWLPAPWGLLALAGLIGVLATAVVLVRRGRTPRRNEAIGPGTRPS